MPNPENIEQHKWKKGQSGNMNGKPKGQTLSTILKEKLERGKYVIYDNAIIISGGGVEPGTKVKVKVKVLTKDMLIDKVIDIAAKKGGKTLETIFERTEGKIEQPIRQINDIDIDITYEDFHSE